MIYSVLSEVEEAPTKCVSQSVTVRVAAQVLFIDFEGRSDGESIRKIVEVILTFFFLFFFLPLSDKFL